MMKTEDLKAQGLTEEQIKYVMTENGKDIETQKALTTAETGKLNTANETITSLQNTVKKFDGVDVGKLKSDLAEAQAKYDTDLKQLKLDNALEMALVGNKARNSKAVKALLNMEEIKLDGDKLLGLDTQLEKLKTDNSFLFDSGDKDTTTVTTGATHADPLDGEVDKFLASAFKGAGIEQTK